jgi:hypothetical protein
MKKLRGYETAIVFGLIGLALVNVPIAVNLLRQFTVSDAEYAEHFGAFVGGYFGSIFSLVALVLLFATLRSQIHATAQQDFETKYFELLKMHRDNVAEIGIDGGSGRRLFVLLLRELRSALEIVRDVVSQSGQQLTQWNLLHISYYCLFYGVGPNSSRMLRVSLSSFNPTLIEAIVKRLDIEETKERVNKERNLGYRAFEGHQSRLGHYYRHLYQMVMYVHEAEPSLDIDKERSVKTIRAQLSTHEQALLLINSLTPIGRNWWANGLITRYGLVKNIPRDFFNVTADFDINGLFDPGYFEWEEAAKEMPNIGPWQRPPGSSTPVN